MESREITRRAIQAASDTCGGTLSGLAGRISVEVKRQNIEYWLRTGRVPERYAAVLERLSSGAVRRWDLFPRDWHLIWPELIGTEGAPAVPADQAEVSP